MLLVLGMAVFGSFVKVWPYNLSFTLNHYTYGFEEAGVENAYLNSIIDGAVLRGLRRAITFCRRLLAREDARGGLRSGRSCSSRR